MLFLGPNAMHCPCHARLQGKVYLASLFCRTASSSSSPFNAHLRSWRSQCLFFYPLALLLHPILRQVNKPPSQLFFVHFSVSRTRTLCACSLGQILLVVIFCLFTLSADSLLRIFLCYSFSFGKCLFWVFACKCVRVSGVSVCQCVRVSVTA